MDRKTILTIAVTGLVFFGWQKYITLKYPNYSKQGTKTEAPATPAPEGEKKSDSNATQEVAAAKGSGDKKPEIVSQEKEFKIETENYTATLSSRGMGVTALTLKNYRGRDATPVKWTKTSKGGLFDLYIYDHPVDFSVTQSQDEAGNVTFKGEAEIAAMKIHRQLKFNKNFSMESKIELENPPSELKDFEIRLDDQLVQSGSGSIFAPSVDFQEVVLHGAEKDERVNVSTAKEPIVNKDEGLRPGYGLSSHYFGTAFFNLSDIIPEVRVTADTSRKEVTATGVYRLTSTQAKMSFAGVGFFGPKDLKIMEEINEATKGDFSYLVNFGYFGAIGKILLKVLQFFHSYTVANWGVAIILLTLLVRMLVLPFNMASAKSMRKMQKIQPQMQAIRERYKADPQKMNAEVMRLMQENKVSPLGGCLPMLLQMPVFFAFYQVLGQSIELYQQPFFGWIQDLSLKDPFFVLPILMGGAMWYNQKITPSTMDPQQAKIMQFMPLVFSVMMVALPSGLTLYIFISTLFGIAQQRVLMRPQEAATVKLAN